MSEDFISDVMIAGEMDAEDFEEALGDAEQRQNDTNRKGRSIAGI